MAVMLDGWGPKKRGNVGGEWVGGKLGELATSITVFWEYRKISALRQYL